MEFTLGEAAKEVGCSKATLSKALKNGDLSAPKRDDGSYAIQPVELTRWNQNRSRKNTKKRSETTVNASETANSNTPQSDREVVAVLQAQIKDLQGRLDRSEEARERIEDDRERLSDRLLASMASAAPERPAERRVGFWGRVVGKRP